MKIEKIRTFTLMITMMMMMVVVMVIVVKAIFDGDYEASAI